MYSDNTVNINSQYVGPDVDITYFQVLVFNFLKHFLELIDIFVIFWRGLHIQLWLGRVFGI